MTDIPTTGYIPALPGQQNASLMSLPVAIEYPAVLRHMAVTHDDYPKYLLAPEISSLAPLAQAVR